MESNILHENLDSKVNGRTVIYFNSSTFLPQIFYKGFVIWTVQIRKIRGFKDQI